MNNDLPEDRARLITKLNGLGIPAYELHSGGGIYHVAVTLLDDQASGDLLQIVTGSGMSPCDLGLMGWKDGADWESHEWEPIYSDQQAIERFVVLWSNRNESIDTFRI